MKTEFIKHIILREDTTINQKLVKKGVVVKKDFWVTSSDGIVLSNFPNTDVDELWNYCLGLVEKGVADFIYKHVNTLEENEKPQSCNGCPHQSFTSGYFGNKVWEHRKCCNAMGLNTTYHIFLKNNIIEECFQKNTKPKECPKN